MAFLVAVVLAASLVLGGGTRAGFLGDAIIQLAAIPLLVLLLMRLRPAYVRPWIYVPALLALAVCSAVAWQLLPVPRFLGASAWTHASVLAALEAAGNPSFFASPGLYADGTWFALLSLLPAVAIFLGVLCCGYPERRALSLVVCAVGLVSVLLGFLQVAQGPSSGLRFFAQTNPGESVGFFANKNHFAAMAYALLLLVAAWTLASVRELDGMDEGRGDSIDLLKAAMGAVTIVVLLAAQATARSRAGIALTVMALVAIVLLAMSMRARRGRGGLIPWMLGTLVVAAGIVGQFALGRVLQTFARDPLEDERVELSSRTLEALTSFLPAGSGAGTFVPVYKTVEWPGPITGEYANRAHNDFLEVGLEYGLPGIALGGTLVLWIAWRALRMWLRPHGTSAIDQALVKVSGLIAVLILVHSLFDYPLRTAGMLAIFAFALGFLLPPAVLDPDPEPEPEDEVAYAGVPGGFAALPPVRAGAATASGPLTKWEAPVTSESGASTPGARWGHGTIWPAEWSRPAAQGAGERGIATPRSRKDQEPR
jgi:hypothetical protein